MIWYSERMHMSVEQLTRYTQHCRCRCVSCGFTKQVLRGLTDAQQSLEFLGRCYSINMCTTAALPDLAGIPQAWLTIDALKAGVGGGLQLPAAVATLHNYYYSCIVLVVV